MGKKLLIKYQDSDRSEEYFLNSDFENWTGLLLDDWSIVVSGGSTVTQETTKLRPSSTGTSAVRFTYDATPGNARITQTISAKKESWAYFKFWYICENFSSSQNFGILIVDSGTNVYLQDDLKTWSSASNTIPIPSSDVWTFFEIEFLLHPDYSDYFIGFGNGNTITSAYVIIDDAEFKNDTTYVATQNIVYNGAQYLAALSGGDISISKNVAYKGELEQSGFSIRVQNNIPHGDSRNIIGKNAIAMEEDGTRIGSYRITNVEKYINETEYQFTDGFAELSNNNAILEMTEEAFPDSPEDSIGTTINRFSGQFLVNLASNASKRNFIIARRKKNRVLSTSDGIYIIGLSIQNISSLQYVTAPDDTDVTSSCTLVTPTGSDPYHYILYDKVKADEEYLKVQFTYPAISAQGVIEEIGELLFPNYPFNTVDIDLFSSGRNYNKVTGGLQDRTDPRFLLDKSRSFKDILKDICQSYNFSYYIDSNENIKFKLFDLNAAYDSGETEIINDDLAANFTSSGYDEPYRELTNQLSASWGYDGDGSNKKNTAFNVRESQKRNNTIRNDSIELSHFPANLTLSKRMADCTSRLWMLDKFYSQRSITFKIESISDEIRQGVTIDDILVPMKILAFRHIAFNDGNLHYLQIRRISRIYPKDYATVQFIDVSDIADIDGNTSLLIQSDNDNGSLIMLDRAPNGFHTINNNNNGVKHDSAYPLFSTTTLTRNTTTPDLQIGLFGFYSDLHIFAALAANGFASSELSCWVRFNNTGNQEFIISQYIDGNNRWGLRKTVTDKINIAVIDTGATVLNLTSTTSVADGKFHHIVFYRDTNDDIGLYIDGQQEAYSSASLNTIFSVLFTGLNNGNATFYFDGNIQDLSMALNPTGITERTEGWFDLAPDVGLTNKYTAPWGLRSRFWREYWINR